MKQYLLLLELSFGVYSSVIAAKVILADSEESACSKIDQVNNRILDCQPIIDNEAETILNYITD